ncbi:hypothetical protein DFR86_06985 [Acidianus sulfidivorans JP7]|uniref:Uncharacterized protein n=1 Tax=Acidianus sulfidivorans JP7 TaxID=619593 RepID=A0A2U9IMT6_9CREN|nr:hypothetical protein [Acidianus sulfidivorans]AWR97317.1 hypothetical protein DFR86_06985 [Acidianus sulfidivorans JP7]
MDNKITPLITGIDKYGKIIHKEFLLNKNILVNIDIYDDKVTIKVNNEECSGKINECYQLMKKYNINNITEYLGDRSILEEGLRQIKGHPISAIFIVHLDDYIIPFFENNCELNRISYEILRNYQESIKEQINGGREIV